MKRTLTALLVAALFVTNFSMCDVNDAQAASKPKLSKKTVEITVGKTTRLKVKNTKKKVTWSTNKKNCLKLTKKSKYVVSVKAKKAGTAKVYAKTGTKKLTCKVKIAKAVQKTSATTSPTSTTSAATTSISATSAPVTIPATVVPVTAASSTPAIITAAPTATTSPAPVFSATPTPAIATAPPATAAATVKDDGNLTYSADVTSQMCTASYWANLLDNPDEVLMTPNEIDDLNASTLTTDDINMYDLSNLSDTFNGTKLKNSFGIVATPTKDYYINGVALADKEAYFEAMRQNIMGATTTETDTLEYALVVKRADMHSWPTNDCLSYKTTDADDELLSSSMNVNEPFVIKAKTADGKFYWGMSTNCTGWVSADTVAICKTKEEWLESWTGTGNDILVVTTNHITLEASNFETATSEVVLHLGTELNLVPEDEIPQNLSERGTWNNYVVYIPTRDDNGYYVKKAALISQHYNVNVGYLPLTQRNLLSVAFECLGDRYGWGGMLGAMDCSMYTRSIYRCFGLELPRNTTWQQLIPTTKYDLTGMTDEQKSTLFDTLPAGTLFYFNGHTMMYVGKTDGMYYVISATGSLVDNTESTTVLSMYSVILNSLDVKRKNGSTWLTNLTTALVFQTDTH